MANEDELLQQKMREQVTEDMVRTAISDVVGESEDYMFSNCSYSEWITRYTRKGTKAWEYSDHPFQIDIINDPSLHLAIKKGAQIGISDTLIRKAIAQLARNERTKVLYVMPTDPLAKLFSDTRVGPLFDDSPLLKRYLHKTDNLMRKCIKDSWLIITSGWEYRSLQMMDIDFLYIDEFDRHKMELLGSMRTRMAHSQYNFEYDFSTPTFKDVGIDVVYNNSDKKQWFVKCPKCDEWQVISYESFMFYPSDEEHENPYFGCCRCKTKLDGGIKYGHWRATEPKCKSGISGYQVTQAMAVGASVKLTTKNIYDMRFNGEYLNDDDYWNFVWGEAVKGNLSNDIDSIDYGSLFNENIADPRHNSMFSDKIAVMGIDWGKPWNFAEIRLVDPNTGKGEISWIECFETKNPGDAAMRMIELARDCRAEMVCADIGYEDGRGYAMKEALAEIFWDVSSNAMGNVVPSYDIKTHRVRCVKESILKHHFVLLSRGEVSIARDPVGVPLVKIGKRIRKPTETWIDHHQSMTLKKDRNGDEEIVFSAPNHLLLASSYCDLAFEFVRKQLRARRQREKRSIKISIVGGGRQ